MTDLFKKVSWIITHRPLHFWRLAGQYWRFRKTGVLARYFLTPAKGVTLGENVRIQRIRCLNAERPGAHIHIDRDSIVYEKAQIEAYGNGQIFVGESSILGDARIYARNSVRLGRRVVTSWNVFIQDFDPHPIEPDLRRAQILKICEGFRPRYRKPQSTPLFSWNFSTLPIEIGDDVWLGANCTILKGAKIGHGCVVATGAVVTAGTYPDRSILAGMPAKVVQSIP